jgi:hypothetical protein
MGYIRSEDVASSGRPEAVVSDSVAIRKCWLDGPGNSLAGNHEAGSYQACICQFFDRADSPVMVCRISFQLLQMSG